MLTYHRTVTCPRCEMIAERTSRLSDELYGSPYRVCPCCGKTYFDPEYQEDAIAIYKSKGGKLTAGGFLWVLLSNGIVAWYIFGGIRTKTLITNSLFFVMLGIALLFDIGLIRIIRSRLKADAYHQDQIDYLEGVGGAIPEQLAESMERVSDRKYLDALRSHGVDVPEYFYKRLGSEEGTFAEPEGIEEAESYYLNV